MHPFSILTLGIFVAGYITARWDLVTRLYELAIFAWDHGVVVCLCSAICSYAHSRYPNNGRTNFLTRQQTRTAKGFLLLSVFFFLLVLPINHIAATEGELVCYYRSGWLAVLLRNGQTAMRSRTRLIFLISTLDTCTWASPLANNSAVEAPSKRGWRMSTCS